MVDNSRVPSKRPRGRPPGSKNKPKSVVIENNEYANTAEPLIIEIAAGNDVIESLIDISRLRQVHLTVLGAYGIVSDILIRHPFTPNVPALPYHGLHTMISLTGNCMNSHFPSIDNDSPCQKNFRIKLSGSQHEIYGGIVEGKVIAASLVVVTTIMVKDFEQHKESYINRNMLIEEGEVSSSSIGDQHSSDSVITVVSNSNA